MKSLTRTIIALVLFNLTAAGPAQAQFGNGPITYTISGKVGMAGVAIKGLGRSNVPIFTDQNGYYQCTVNYGWSGTVKPVKEGYIFEPVSKVYRKVTNDLRSEDYKAEVVTFTISGSTRLFRVEIAGLPGNPITDETGSYVATVPYGWSGAVTPRKEGYAFEPPRRSYSRVISDQTSGDYQAKLVMLAISGQVILGGVPIDGVLFSADNDGGSATTDAQGRYSLKVPYGWSGNIYPSKKGIRFSLPSMTFTNVTTNMVNGKPEQPKEEEADPFGGFGSSGLRRRSRGSDPYPSPPLPPGLSGSRSRSRSSSGFKPAIRSGGRKVIVIPAGEVKAEDIAETIEDMHVMSHILDEGFKEKRRIQGFFTDFGDFFGRDSRNTEATYLQGFGALFLMEVNFAFSPPPKQQAQDPAETNDAVDSTWQKARRQVFSPGASPGMGEQDSADDYDNQMVEELKRELIRTLKHAANIRNVQPDEWIILTVIGQARQPGGMYEDYYRSAAPRSGLPRSRERSPSSSRGSYGRGDAIGGGGFGGGVMIGGGGMYAGMEYGETGSTSATVLTIRAKKTDVDDFARGELDFEQFQQKVDIFTY